MHLRPVVGARGRDARALRQAETGNRTEHVDKGPPHPPTPALPPIRIKRLPSPLPRACPSC
jgi:hypothetical protein